MYRRKFGFQRHAVPQMKLHSPITYCSQWFYSLERKRLHIESTVITVSLTTVAHEAKNHCNFSIADISRPISFISQKREKWLKQILYMTLREKVRFLIKCEHPHWPTGIQVISPLHLNRLCPLQFLVLKKALVQLWATVLPPSQPLWSRFSYSISQMTS